jgi:osmotically-inducible protein OsmY
VFDRQKTQARRDRQPGKPRAGAGGSGSQLTTDTAVDDRTIRERLLAELKGQEWVHLGRRTSSSESASHIWVSDDRPPEERQAMRAAENIPGVQGVEEHLVPAPG